MSDEPRYGITDAESRARELRAARPTPEPGQPRTAAVKALLDAIPESFGEPILMTYTDAEATVNRLVENGWILVEAAASPPDGWIEGKPLESPAPLDVPLEETMTRISDTGHGRWHDEVLPNGGGDSWACVPIGEVLEALARSEGTTGPLQQPVAPGLDVDFQRERMEIARVARDLVQQVAGPDRALPLGKRVSETSRVLDELVAFHEAEYARLSGQLSNPTGDS